MWYPYSDPASLYVSKMEKPIANTVFMDLFLDKNFSKRPWSFCNFFLKIPSSLLGIIATCLVYFSVFYFFLTLVRPAYSAFEERIHCEDGSTFFLTSPHGLTRSIEQAKRDGPIIYGRDKAGNIYSFEQTKNVNQIQRTEIFRFPYISTFYSAFINNSNSFQLPKDSSGEFVPWALSHIRYNANARTISLFMMTQNNPIHIRNMDPWLPPWQVYEHAGPIGITGVNIAAGDQTLVVFGYNATGNPVMSFRHINFDLSGSNPMMTYQYPEGYSSTPYWLIKKLGEKIGVPQTVEQVPASDWTTLPLTFDHQPYARIKAKGNHLVIPKNSGGASLYDISTHEWLEDLAIFDPPVNYEWPELELPLYSTPQIVPAVLNGKEGYFLQSSAEPKIGCFREKEDHNPHNLYRYSKGFLNTLLNKKEIFDEQGKAVHLLFQLENK